MVCVYAPTFHQPYLPSGTRNEELYDTNLAHLHRSPQRICQVLAMCNTSLYFSQVQSLFSRFLSRKTFPKIFEARKITFRETNLKSSTSKENKFETFEATLTFFDLAS